ncbi:MAG: TetR/AcrR family transcriptional regulator, partial [Leifsonia sp.]
MRPRKQSTIIASAQQLFLTRGYDGTSLDDIATDCGVSKTTVYNNFADKDALFTAVITQVIGHAESIIEELRGLLKSSDPLATRLQDVGRRLVSGVLNPAVVQLRRIAIAEAFRFPDLVSSYWEQGPAKTIELLACEFEELTAAGE